MYGLEAILRIECEMPSFKLVIKLLRATSTKQECLLHLIRLDEAQLDAASANEAHKSRIKAQYDESVKARILSKGDVVLLYDQEANKLGQGNFQPMWLGPYIVKRVLAKGGYELVDLDGVPLA